MRISDCGFNHQSRERQRPATTHGPRVTEHTKAYWPNEPKSSQDVGDQNVNVLVASNSAQCRSMSARRRKRIMKQQIAPRQRESTSGSGWFGRIQARLEQNQVVLDEREGPAAADARGRGGGGGLDLRPRNVRKLHEPRRAHAALRATGELKGLHAEQPADAEPAIRSTIAAS